MKSTRRWKRVAGQNEDKAGDTREKVLKVLIVEDNGFNVLPIQSTLKKFHISYDLAKNGLMAVDRYNDTMKEGYHI